MKFFLPLLTLLPLFIASCSSQPSIDYSPAPTVTRQEALQIAESYRSHQWRPDESNIKHGLDKNGILVNTPDTSMDLKVAARPGWWKPNQINQAIPYMWGGFDSPIEFDKKLARGYYAGDVYTAAKRVQLDEGVSLQATGVDCSGFISKCWRLASHHSTRELPSICEPITYSELKPGDILSKYNTHVLLFSHWMDPEKTAFVAYETGTAPTWKVLRHGIRVTYVRSRGYLPYRYKKIQ